MEKRRGLGEISLPQSYWVVYALSVALALCVGNWMRPLSGPWPAAGTTAGSPATPHDARIEECKALGEKYTNRLLKDAKGDYVNDFNETMLSPVFTAHDPTFLQLALPAGTDKVTVHSYHYLYSKHLAHARFHDLNILELGLGCFMKTGAGNSLKVWRAYMPCAKISFLEHIRDCAEEWRSVIEKESGGKLYIGEQNDADLLQEMADDAKKFGGYDMIVDDGSHFPSKQMMALEYLWPAVKPGGIYVIEDFYKAFTDADVDLKVLPKPDEPIPLIQRLILTMNCQSVAGVHYTDANKKWCKEHQDNFLFSDVVNVDCMAETCALMKGQDISYYKY